MGMTVQPLHASKSTSEMANNSAGNSNQLLETLPLEQQAGLFVWPSLAGPEISPEEKYLLSLYKPSGVVLFRRSMKTLAQARKLCAEIHELTKADHQPLGAVVAIDEEGGRVYRMPAPFPRIEPAAAFASPEREDDLRSQIILQASTAKAIGIDCMIAPVVDVLTRTDNPAIGDRSFSPDAETVSRCAKIVAEEIRRAGLLSCAKHFPGHGHTDSDSHKGFATTDVALEVLRMREWLPFRSLIESSQIPMIMTAHVICKSIDSAVPATLNATILKTHLRTELNYEGLILSDDLRMNAISDHYCVAKKVTAAIVDDGQNPDDVSDDSFLRSASCDALEAGCDVLLSCQSIVREKTVLEAVRDHLATHGVDRWKDKLERVQRLLLNRRSLES
ncbi:MAG: glycoside hydrolase family 3 N-terminal domain-containing protein [Silvanigrellaceae bacterium]